MSDIKPPSITHGSMESFRPDLDGSFIPTPERSVDPQHDPVTVESTRTAARWTMQGGVIERQPAPQPVTETCTPEFNATDRDSDLGVR